MGTPPGPTPRHVLVTAAAGYGRTSLLHAQRPEGGVVLPAVEVVAGGFPEDVSWVGVDDVHHLDADGRARLRDLLSRAPGRCLLSSRTALEDVCPPAWSGRVSARDATRLLRLGPYAVARVLADRAAVVDPAVALAVTALTGGWPMLVGLAAEALARDPRGDVTAAVAGAGTPGSAWVRTEVLADLSRGRGRGPAGARRGRSRPPHLPGRVQRGGLGEGCRSSPGSSRR